MRKASFITTLIFLALALVLGCSQPAAEPTRHQQQLQPRKPRLRLLNLQRSRAYEGRSPCFWRSERSGGSPRLAISLVCTPYLPSWV